MANELRTAALADSPIALYDFISGSESADSGTGSYDLTATSVTQGTASYFDGEAGTGLFDDAVPSQASVTNAAFDDLLQADSDLITIEALVRMDGYPDDKYIVSKGTPGGGDFWGLFMDMSNTRRPTFIAERATTNQVSTVTNGSYVIGDWYFIQCVVGPHHTTNAARWFVNGIPMTTSNTSTGAGSYTSDSGTPFKVGYNGTAGQEFSGDIAFLAIYDGDIGDTALYNHMMALLDGDSNYNAHIKSHNSLKVFWPQDELGAWAVINNSIFDDSGTGNHGETPNGAPGSYAGGLITDNNASYDGGDYNGVYTRVKNSITTQVWTAGTSYTVEGWYQPDTLPTSGADQLANSWYAGNENYALSLRSTTEGSVYRYTFKDSSNANQVLETVTAAQTTTPVHLVMVYDSTAGRTLYYNGVAAATTTDTYHKTVTVRNLAIHGWNNGFSTGTAMFGASDKVAFYDEALSAEEVLIHYNLGIDGEISNGNGGGGGGKAVKARRRGGGGSGGGANGSKGGGGRSASRALARWDRRRRRLS